MVVQASGARRLAERDPARASDAFLAVETSGREALTEIRRLLGVLRRDDEELALAPQPSLRHVGSLRAQGRGGRPAGRAGASRATSATCRSASTSPPTASCRRRSAARSSTATPATRRCGCSYAADHVELEVADDGGAPARPLLGIRERVALSGGQLRAGARRDGGHVVRARLPLGGAGVRRLIARCRRLDRRAARPRDRRCLRRRRRDRARASSGTAAGTPAMVVLLAVAYSPLAFRRSRPLLAAAAIFGAVDLRQRRAHRRRAAPDCRSSRCSSSATRWAPTPTGRARDRRAVRDRRRR